MEEKYLILWTRVELPPRYCRHPAKYTRVSAWTPDLTRNAIFNMITNGEQEIERVLAIMSNGKSGPPCGACRELMVQLMPGRYQNIQVLIDLETEEIVTLDELTPKWWI